MNKEMQDEILINDGTTNTSANQEKQEYENMTVENKLIRCALQKCKSSVKTLVKVS